MPILQMGTLTPGKVHGCPRGHTTERGKAGLTSKSLWFQSPFSVRQPVAWCSYQGPPRWPTPIPAASSHPHLSVLTFPSCSEHALDLDTCGVLSKGFHFQDPLHIEVCPPPHPRGRQSPLPSGCPLLPTSISLPGHHAHTTRHLRAEAVCLGS